MKYLRILQHITFVIFCYLLILITLQYIPINTNTAFLMLKVEEVKIFYYPFAFFTHVFSSIFCLILGYFLFIDKIRKKHIRIHQNLGKIYIIIVLLMAGPSGLIISLHANGGIYARVSFMILSLCWLVFTGLGYISIKNKNFDNHEKWMIRSYALTLSAISLRFFKWLIVLILELPPLTTYQIVAWIGWVFNILLAEFIIYNKFKKNILNKKKLVSLHSKI